MKYVYALVYSLIGLHRCRLVMFMLKSGANNSSCRWNTAARLSPEFLMDMCIVQPPLFTSLRSSKFIRRRSASILAARYPGHNDHIVTTPSTPGLTLWQGVQTVSYCNPQCER